MNITDTGAMLLTAAIVKQAAFDYRKARKFLEKDEELLKEIDDLTTKAKDMKAERLMPNGKWVRMSDEEKKNKRLLNTKRCRYNYHQRLLRDSTDFFQSNLFYQMGGTEYMFEKLKSDCDMGIYSHINWN